MKTSTLLVCVSLPLLPIGIATAAEGPPARPTEVRRFFADDSFWNQPIEPFKQCRSRTELLVAQRTASSRHQNRGYDIV